MSCMEEETPKPLEEESKISGEDSAFYEKRNKLVRRRLNTARPYQEKLLDMAEARREVVAALKLHRSAMKEASEQQQKKLIQISNPSQIDYRSYYLRPFSHSHLSQIHSRYTPLHISKPNQIKFPLFNQPLGLDLDFQGFANARTPLFSADNEIDHSIHQQIVPSSSSSSTSSSSSSLSSPSSYNSYSSPTAGKPLANNLTLTDPSLHRVMGDEEMEEIRSLSEKHGVEWNDTVNSVMAAWWSNYLKNLEEDDGETNEGDAIQIFNEAIGIPDGLGDDGLGITFCNRSKDVNVQDLLGHGEGIDCLL